MKRFHAFLIALQFLTRLPVRLPDAPGEQAIGRSLLYYPLVGLLLGFTLAALAWALGEGRTLLHAAILLVFWVLMSGALHLDGLADSADAWAGGQGDRERSLAIMKDPACGPAGAVALILVLLVKLTALEALAGQSLPLVLAPMLGRAALLALFLTTPYVRPGGLGEVHARALPRRPAVIVVLVIVGAIPMTMGSDGLWMLASVFTAFMLTRAAMLRRLGGATGDTAGAVVEITESAVLITAAMV